MKNKTPLQELLAAINDLPPLAVYQWTEANKSRLLEAELNMVALAYVAGIDMDWGSEAYDIEDDATRNPEYGYEYFDCRYGKE